MKKMITVAHLKGGVGKTSFAQNLALYLANVQGEKVLALDCEPVQKSLEIFFRDRADKLQTHELTCQNKSHPKGLALEIQHLAKDFERTVIDVGGKDSDALRQVLIASEVLIIPTNCGQESLDSLDELFQIIDMVKGVNAGLAVYIVLNQCPIDGKDTTGDNVYSWLTERYKDDATILKTRFKHRKAWLNCRFALQTIFEGKKGEATFEFNRFIKELKVCEVI